LRIPLPEPRSHNNISYSFILKFIEPFYFDAEFEIAPREINCSRREFKEAAAEEEEEEEEEDTKLVDGKFRFQRVGRY
jgi:hypothetical protein